MIAGVIAVGAAIAAAYVSVRIFERIPHLEDEFAILWQAEIMAEGEIMVPSPPEPKSFLIPFVVDFEGQRFGKYTPGWPAALSIGSRFHIYWLINPLLAGLTVWLVYRLGMKVVNRWAGLLASGLVAISPMFLMLAGSLMPHALSLFLATGFMLAWLDLFPIGSNDVARADLPPKWILVPAAGLCAGLLVLTRPLTAVGVLAPFLVHALILAGRRGRAVRQQLIAIAGIGSSAALLLPLWNLSLTGDPVLNPYTLWWPYDRVGFGPGYGVTEVGHNLTLAYYNANHSLRAGVHDLFGWPWLSWIFLPFGLFALRANRKAWLITAVLPSLVLIYSTYWIGSWLFGPRYYYEALPAMAIVSAAGVLWLGGFLEDQAQTRWRGPAVIGLVGLLTAANLAFYLPARLGGMKGLYGISRAHIAPIEAAQLDDALIFVHAERWQQYAQLRLLTWPFTESDLLVAWSRGSVIDKELADLFPTRTVLHYDPATPGYLYAIGE